MFSKLTNNEKNEINSIINWIFNKNKDFTKILTDEDYMKNCINEYKESVKNEN